MSSYSAILLLFTGTLAADCFATCTCPSTTVDDITIIENIEVLKKQGKKALRPENNKKPEHKKPLKKPVQPSKKPSHLPNAVKIEKKQVKKLEEKYQELKQALNITATESKVIDQLRKQNEALISRNNELQTERDDMAAATVAVTKVVEEMSNVVKSNAQKIRALEALIQENRQLGQKTQDQLRFANEAASDYQEEIKAIRTVINKQNDTINRLSETSIALARKIDQDNEQLDDHTVTLNQYGNVINKQTAALKSYGEAINNQARVLEKYGNKFEQIDSLNNDHQIRFRDVEGKVADSKSLISEQMERVANLESQLARRFTALSQAQQEMSQRQQSYVQQSPVPQVRTAPQTQPYISQQSAQQIIPNAYSQPIVTELPPLNRASGAYSVERVSDCYIPRSTRR